MLHALSSGAMSSDAFGSHKTTQEQQWTETKGSAPLCKNWTLDEIESFKITLAKRFKTTADEIMWGFQPLPAEDEGRYEYMYLVFTQERVVHSKPVTATVHRCKQFISPKLLEKIREMESLNTKTAAVAALPAPISTPTSTPAPVSTPAPATPKVRRPAPKKKA